MRVRLIILLGVCLCGLVGQRPAYGQGTDDGSYTLVLRGVPMAQALEEIVRLTEIDLVYNSHLVAGKHVYCSGRRLSAEALLQCVLARSGLDYVRSSSGAYVLMEGLKGASRYGNLAGSIVDQATGEPLPYANVLLADASAGTTTDEAGLFSFSSVLTGVHRIVVTYVGYEAAVDSVWVEADDEKRLEIALRPKEVAMTPIVIDGLAQRLPSSALGMGTLASRQLVAFHEAGTPDVARGAGGLPGVAVQQPLADLHIQGGASGEHLTLLDGVPVRDPVSLGRHLSAFSPLAIERLTVHKAGFGAEHGSHLSGVVAVEQDVTGTAHQGVVFSADPVSFNAKVQGRFVLPGARQGAVMAAVRSSVWDLYRDPGVGSLLQHWNQVDPTLASIWVREEVNTGSLDLYRHQSDLAFSDAHAAVRLHLSPFRILHASAYRASNHIASDLLAVNADHGADPDLLILTRDDYEWTNWAGQVRHSWLIGARSVGTLQAQGAWHRSRYAYLSMKAATEPLTTPEAIEEAAAAFQPELGTSLGSDEGNKVDELSMRATLSHSFSPRHHVEVGLAATHVDSWFRLRNQFVASFEHEAAAWDLAGYAKGDLSFGLPITLEPSIRLTYLPLRQTAYAEPRLALRYDRAASRIGPYAVRLAAGVYRQFTNQFELSSSGSTSVVPSVLFWLPVDSTLAPPRVYHLASEVLFMPVSNWTISLEGYYKAQPRLLTVDYVALLADNPAQWPPPEPVAMQQSDFISPTRGRAYGGSVRVQWSRSRLSTSMSYGFSRALRAFPGRFDGRMEPAPWNVPHRLTLDATVALNDVFSADVNWRSAWGQRWALRRAYYDYLALRDAPGAFGAFDLNQPSDQKLSPYHRLDVGLTYEQPLGPAAVQVRAFVVNVFGRNNVYDWSLEQRGEEVTRVNRTLPGRQAVLSFRFNY